MRGREKKLLMPIIWDQLVCHGRDTKDLSKEEDLEIGKIIEEDLGMIIEAIQGALEDRVMEEVLEINPKMAKETKDNTLNLAGIMVKETKENTQKV